MWPKPLLRFLLLLSIGLGVLFSTPTEASPSSATGPKYSGELEILWKKARTHFSNGEYESAAYFYNRIIDRYPATPHYTDAYLYLTLSYHRLGQYKEAIAPIKYYIKAKGRSTEAYRGKLILCHTYLKTEKFNEALLQANEIILPQHKGRVPFDVHLSALMAKSWAWMSLNNHLEARRSLDAFWTQTKNTKNVDPDMIAQAHRIRLEIKLRKCAQLPEKNVLPEEQAIAQYMRRNTCLLEAIGLFQSILRIGASRWQDESIEALINGFRKAIQASKSPPRPPEKKTAAELKSYKSELMDLLLKKLQETISKSVEIISSWSGSFSEGSENAMKKTIRDLKALKDN